MNNLIVVLLLYFFIGLYVGLMAVEYARLKPRGLSYWPKFWMLMIIGWPGFIWAIRKH